LPSRSTPSGNESQLGSIEETDIVGDALKGLTSSEAQSRLRTEGYNELPRAEQRAPLRIAFEVVREPMFGLLIASGIIYLLLGNLTEALLLLAARSSSRPKRKKRTSCDGRLVRRRAAFSRGRSCSGACFKDRSHSASLPPSISRLFGSDCQRRMCARSPSCPSCSPTSMNRSFESSLGAALRRDNLALWYVGTIATVLLGLVLAWEPARGLFRFGQLHSDDLAVAFFSAALLVVTAEVSKRFWRGRLIA
jgi:hypothetical protein